MCDVLNLCIYTIQLGRRSGPPALEPTESGSARLRFTVVINTFVSFDNGFHCFCRCLGITVGECNLNDRRSLRNDDCEIFLEVRVASGSRPRPSPFHSGCSIASPTTRGL